MPRIFEIVYYPIDKITTFLYYYSAMFARTKIVGNKEYIQIVENKYIDGKVKQRVICSLGRLDKLKEKGNLEKIIKSLIKFSGKLKVIEAYHSGSPDIKVLGVKKIGPDIVFGKLWKELNLKDMLESYQEERKFSFNLERALYFSVLQRLFNPSSDRQEYILKRDYEIEGIRELKLHHIYRAIEWLGKNKSGIEKELFFKNRDLFTGLNLVFIDTTSIYFEGENSKSSLLEYGFSKERKPFCKQVILNIAIDSNSRPMLCDIFKGNTSDIRIFLPTVKKIKKEFGVKDFCVVADRGMVSSDTMKELEKSDIGYILGFKLRAQKREFIEKVVKSSSLFSFVKENLKAKEIVLNGKRYILCLNEEEVKRDRIQREQVLSLLEEKISQDPRGIIRNASFRKYLKINKSMIEIDKEKIEKDMLFDGIYCLITNTNLEVKDVVLRYKELWQIERLFREIKNTLRIRPVFHRTDMTIKGHIFCGFLGLVLMKELYRRLKDLEEKISFHQIRQDLSALYNVEVFLKGKTFTLRSPFQGVGGRIFQILKIKS